MRSIKLFMVLLYHEALDKFYGRPFYSSIPSNKGDDDRIRARIEFVGHGSHLRHDIGLAAGVSSQCFLGSDRVPNRFVSNHFIDSQIKLIGAAQFSLHDWMKCEGLD